MTTLKESAMNYTPQGSKNISDLEVVSTEQITFDREGIDAQTGKPYTYKAIIVNGEDYRVPDSVIAQLKAILNVNPKLQKFRVAKTGQGMSTRYSVVPLL